tara:strand:+ start:401 stop:592 length:192 start_codon:yes stop_codon:yes gene_type:complete
MDYVDYKVRTFLTQSAGCDEWDDINKQLLAEYNDGMLSVVWENNGEPFFFTKNAEQQSIYIGG